MGLVDGEAGLHLVREALEGMIEPTAASAALFEALERQGADELPGSSAELLDFVRGPLRAVVERRIGNTGADEIVERVERTVQRVESGLPLRNGGAATTLEINVGTGPVRVLSLSKSTSLAVRLRAALGGLQVHVVSASDLARAATTGAKHDPDVVVIDATAPITDDADGVMTLLSKLKPTSTSVLWGEELAFGRTLKHEAVQRRLKLTTVERSEGVDLLLDLIRSRQH
jgi:hypothetical protein